MIARTVVATAVASIVVGFVGLFYTGNAWWLLLCLPIVAFLS